MERLKRVTMNDLEFYIYEDELWCIYPDGRNEVVTESSKELIKNVLSIIREQFPDAYTALSECYKKSATNVPYYQFLMVNRFCKCNFGVLDSTKKDIDYNGKFNFEKVQCPLRGECKYEGIICGATFCSRLSPAELRVAKLVYEGKTNEEIAAQLYLSPHTVKNHIKSCYLKLGIHEKSELIRYANSHDLFKD